MMYKNLGRTGDKIPAMGMGSWELAGGNGDGVEALKHGLELGIKFIDTAEIYGTEETVGKALKGQKDVFVATKVWPNHFKHDDVIRACNSSLAKLGISTIDLYQLHWPNYNVPISETMSAMEELQKQGKIRHIGVSNFSAKEVEVAQSVMKNSEIVSNQIEYSVVVREPEMDFVEYSRKNGTTVIAYSPLAHGVLYDNRNGKLMELLSEIGKKYGKTATQVALNWLISKENVVAIPKANSARHVDENFGAVGFKLKEGDVGMIDEQAKAFGQRSLAASFKERNRSQFGDSRAGLKV